MDSFIFNGNDPNINQQLRQRIALAMMAKQKRFPKTFGEGLSAIGDSLGEMGTMRQLLEADKAATAAGNAKADELLGTPPGEPPAGGAPPARAAYTPPADTEPDPAPTALARSVAPPAPAPGSLPPTGEPGNTGATTFPPPGGYPRLPVLDQSKFNSIDAMAPNAPPALARSAAPPVMAQGEDDPRRSVALEMLKQSQFGQPQNPNFGPAGDDPRRAAGLDMLRQQMPGGQPAPVTRGIEPAPPALPPAATPPQDPRQAVTEAMAPKPPVVAFDGPSTPPSPVPPPPQQQIRQAPPVSPRLPPPGYVPQTPNEVIPPQPQVMSPTEAKLRDALARNPNDEQLARRLSPVIQTLEASRAAENARRIEQYKADLQQRNTLTGKVEDAKITAPQRAADYEKTQQEIRKGNLPEAIDVEGKVMRDPVTGLLSRPKIEGEGASEMPNVKLTEDQRKTLTFHGWAALANTMLKDQKTANLLAHGAGQEALGKVPVFGNQLQQDEYRRAKNAANNFVLAFMRSTSGAAYGPKEAEDHARAMLPKQGDDAKTLADKADQRNNFVQTLYGGLGPGRQVADYLAKERRNNGPDTNSAAMDAKQQAIDNEMKNVKPLAFGDKRVNKKTGVTRTWNGSHWVEM